MDTAALASAIAAKVAADTSFWVAVVGMVGVFTGSAITVVGSLLLHWLQTRRAEQLDKSRMKLLKQMLKDNRFPQRWRKLSTLSRVIGADEEATKRLLIELRARASEQDDGLWGLLEFHPIDSIGE